MTTVDLLILGAGPAGCAAAIQARKAGRSVLLVELDVNINRPKVAPGETFHPGIEPIFKQLGILPAILEASVHRHRGVWINVNGERKFSAYGSDADGPWLGFQIKRQALHQILRTAVLSRGAEIRFSTKPSALLREGGRVLGVMSGDETIHAQWTTDSTGRKAWLAHQIELGTIIASPPLGVRYGWQERTTNDTAEEPIFHFNRGGWRWHAPIDATTVAWAELSIGEVDGPPPLGVDLTWRHRPQAAGLGYFLLGDAAALLDPSSSHGVLRALMSGILCSHLVEQLYQGVITEDQMASRYNNWITGQFNADASQLRQLYEHSPASRLLKKSGRFRQ